MTARRTPSKSQPSITLLLSVKAVSLPIKALKITAKCFADWQLVRMAGSSQHRRLASDKIDEFCTGNHGFWTRNDEFCITTISKMNDHG